MRIIYGIVIALAALMAVGCSESAPTGGADEVMTEARFAELQQEAIEIAERAEKAGFVTSADQARIEALQAELDACVEATVGTGLDAPGSGAVASVPTGPGTPRPCTPCPFIISKGNCIGVLRSQGPCRPGAGLERCFYTWYCYGILG